MEVLLLSTSTLYNERYLEYALDPIREWLGTEREILFVPYALADHDAYTAKVADAFSSLGVKVRGIHRCAAADASAAIADSSHIFVGGGNTFRLLNTLYSKSLLEPIRSSVIDAGSRYLGSSAGTNIAGLTIRTTNDMPIVEPTSFGALGFVPFQLNPHYLDPIPDLPHMGETRETRLTEFLEENDCPVLGLREGAWLKVGGESLRLEGHTARLFQRERPPVEYAAGSDLSWLLKSQARLHSNNA